MLESEKTLLAERIEQKINGRKVMNSREGETKTYEADLLLTRYEKGNAFWRAMLAGLGQIHIDGEVTLIELPERKQVGKFPISKTFAWGIYGRVTSMEDIEQTFADGVAAALTGQKSEEKKQPTVNAKTGAIRSRKRRTPMRTHSASAHAVRIQEVLGHSCAIVSLVMLVSGCASAPARMSATAGRHTARSP